MNERNMNSLDVSIIIVNYNGKELLKNCLASLYKFTEDLDFEVILIDNNSIEPIEDVTHPYTNLTLINNDKNLGFAAANNQGIKLAKGKYILFLNNDTVFIENSIKKVYDFAQSKNERVFVGCRLLNNDNSIQESVVDFPSVWNTFTESFFLYKLFKKSKIFNRYYLNYVEVNKPVEVDFIKGAFMFCDAEPVKELNGFDEQFFFYSEEMDLCYRFKEKGGKIYFFPDTSIVHLGGATTDQNLEFKYINQAKAKIQFCKKHFNSFEFILVFFIFYSGVFIRIPIYFLIGILNRNKMMIAKSKYYLMQLLDSVKNING